MIACSLHQVLHHGLSTSSSVARRGSSPSTRTLSGRSPSSFGHHHQGTASHVRFLLSNHVLYFNMFICVGLILLDNLMQYLLFIAMIDLSRTCGTTASLICYALVMFMIYPWIKKLKVLIFPTIQKPYHSHFSFMAGFVDALRPTLLLV
jgi:hypothetical protein